MTTNAILCLPAMLDLRSAAALKQDLLSYEGAALDVDASKVERAGALGLQVLLAAEASWRRAGLGFRIRNASQAFVDDLNLLGASGMLARDDGGRP